ncbi:MAG: tryptophan synthase subunit alpha [Acidobacteria bacterium]|nr:tryptophan synthase subunit alpha [Acidobacteriota bacterium]
MPGTAARLARVEGQRPNGLIPFITAGDPDLETTGELILALDRAGAAVLELGVPFSDPMADGPVIQRASERALKNRVSVSDCLALAGQARRECSLPIVLFSYLNPLLSFGLERLAEEMSESRIEGLLVTDLTPEESGAVTPAFRARGIDVIFLAAPTSTDDRLELISRAASGFIYAVSRTGVTGVQENLSEAARQLAGRIRRFSSLPVAVGFGVSRPEQVREVWQFADAAVVGSALVREIEQRRGQADLVKRVTDFFRWLKEGSEG